VQQDIFLFSGTILENIAYARPGATAPPMSASA